MIELQKTVTSVLLALTFLVALSPALSLADSDEEGCCAVRCSRERYMWLGAMEEELMRNAGRK